MLLYTASNMNKQGKLVHGFFTKINKAKNRIYKSSKCNADSVDTLKDVVDNNKIICNTLGFAYEDLKTLNQVHSASVITIYNKAEITSNIQADALITSVPNILLGVKTADCVPILFFDIENKIIAAAHAGWKGALAGIIENTILAMKNIGADISTIVTSIGPCIQQKSYEVSQDFHNKFTENNIANSQFFIPSRRTAHHMFNLPGYCVNRLKKNGIQNIDNLGIDTYSNPATLFSFRRATHKNKNLGAEVKYGKQLSIIGML